MKIVTKVLGEKYNNQKAAITKVKDGQATVEVISTGHKLKLGEKHLQTVIPQPGQYFFVSALQFNEYLFFAGKSVLILKGDYRGKKATLHEVRVDKFKAVLSFKSRVILFTVVEK